MAFYGRNFMFNGTMSQELSLTISSDGPESSTDSGSQVTPIIQKTYRRPQNYLLGVEQAPAITFPVSFNSESYINAVLATYIEKKLFGQMGYKNLQVIQPDTMDYYWRCFLTNEKIKRVGGQIVGWDADCSCDSPWAWSFPRTETYPSTGLYTPPISLAATYNNRAGNNDYSFPTVQFTMGVAGGSFSITNITDANRVFSFSGLSANEVITVDNNLQMITSSTGLSRFTNFNKRFFRVLPGLNNFTFIGAVTQVKIIHTDAQKIGG